MSLLDRFRNRAPGPGATPVLIGDPRFDDWEILRTFGDVGTARAFHQTISDAGIDCVLTADWPLDRFGRGDIILQVRPEFWGEAEAYLENLDLD